MPIPFLNSIKLNKNQVEDFCVFNYSGDPTLSSGADFGYLWLNTSATPKVLKFWDGTNYRTLIDSTTISSSTAGLATDLAGGGAGQIIYQDGVNDTKFLAAGTAGQVLSSNGASAPSWLNQSSLSVGSATNKTGGNLGDLLVQTGSGTTSFLNAGTVGQVITSNGASPQYVDQSTLSVGSATTATTATNVAGGANGSILVQSGVGTTGQLAIGANGYILTSNGTTPGWSATIPSSSVSGLAASATTDTTNASNISSGTLGLARLSLATGQFYVGDASGNPSATAKSSIPLSGFGAAGADVAMGGFKITGLGAPTASTDAANKDYVDGVAQGLDVKASCLVATTADITLASPGAVTIDGIYSATDFTAGTTRILVKDQSAPAENGIYIWQGPSSAMTRSADADTWDELVGAFTFVERGTANADSGWVCTVNAGGTLGSTAVTWVKFSQAGSYTQGRGMVLDGTAFNFAQSTNYTDNTIPYASGATTIGFIGAGTADQVLRVPGAGGTPAFGAIDLTKSSAVTGALPIANGGTGATTFTQGQVLFAGASTISSSANLFWDNTNGRLGIGTATPASALEVIGTGIISQNLGIGAAPSYKLHVTQGDLNSYVVFQNNQTLAQYRSMQMVLGNGPSVFGANNRDWRVLNVASSATASDFVVDYWTGTAISEKFKIASDGVCTWSNVGGVVSDAMVLNGTGLGLGVTPSARLHTYISDGGTTNLVEIARLQRATTGTAAVGFGQYLRFDLERGDGANEVAGFIGTKWSNATAGVSKGDLIFGGSDNGAVTTTMVLDASGNLGVGATTPGYKLHVNAANPGNGVIAQFYNNATSSLNGAAIILTQYGIADWYVGQPAGVSALEFGKDKTSGAAGTGLMRLTAEGNLGLGVTPKSWNVFTVFQNKEFSFLGFNYGQGHVTLNAYYQEPSGVPTWKFMAANGYATRYTQESGSHKWFTSTTTSGGADSSLTWTSALMTLDSSGKLGIGSTPSTNLSIGSGSGSGGYDGGVYLNRGGSSYNFFEAGDGTNTVIFGLDHTVSYAKIGSINSYPISLITGNTVRLTVKTTGQLNFVGQASDPAGAAGDVYYNSTAKALKLYATDWKTLPRKAVVQGGAGTGTTIAVAHNLNTNNVSVTVLRTTDNVVVFTDVAITDADTVTITFASSVTKADYTITVIG